MQFMAANGQWRICEYLSAELVVKRYHAVALHLADEFSNTNHSSVTDFRPCWRLAIMMHSVITVSD